MSSNLSSDADALKRLHEMPVPVVADNASDLLQNRRALITTESPALRSSTPNASWI